MAWPSTLTTLTSPNATDKLNSPSHSAIETAQNDAISALEKSVGTSASTLGTIIGDLRNTTSPGGGHVQTAVKGGTGQTSFTKGDVLIALNASTLSKLAVGDDTKVLTAKSTEATGVYWGTGFNTVPTVRVYGGSVTGKGGSSLYAIWYKPSTLSYAIVEVVGGGGGGGGTTEDKDAASGGGGGAYSKKVFVASNLGIAVSVVVGLGGNGGNNSGPGSVGGVTWFGSVLSAAGGSYGDDGGEPGGDGGARPTLGDVNVAGDDGGGVERTYSGTAALLYGGFGGGNPLSAITKRQEGDADGLTGKPYGGGGSGAKSGGDDEDGGKGADGVVIVYEY